jgi:hypothetical protein
MQIWIYKINYLTITIRLMQNVVDKINLVGRKVFK